MKCNSFKMVLEIWISTYKRTELDFYLLPWKKDTNSKNLMFLISDMKPKNYDRKNTSSLIYMCKDFHERTSVPPETRPRNVNWYLVKLESVSTTDETIIWVMVQPAEKRKIFRWYMSDRRLISRIFFKCSTKTNIAQ